MVNGNPTIAGKIVEDCLLAVTPRRDADDPERGVGGRQGEAFVGEQDLELAAHQLGQRLIRHKKRFAPGVD
jgi:hypothetical protein